jgi:replication-associated recombination protein RarA
MKMCFVGREKEIRKLTKALEGGHHVIVTGPYGIGRTRLVRQVAKTGRRGRRFVFVDFSKTPGEVCEKLLAFFLPKTPSGRVVRSTRYRIGRNLLAGMRLPDERKPVVVLDNIGRLTRQQLSFLRDLNLENRYLFIAIVESFLPERPFFLLRACLFPSETIILHHLAIRDSYGYFQYVASKHHLSLTNHVTFLAEAGGGYPLGMRETAQRLLKRHAGEADRVSPEGGARSWEPI